VDFDGLCASLGCQPFSRGKRRENREEKHERRKGGDQRRDRETSSR
jgi:site-specific DNA-cytosine methylase